jgi:hypothetical protein
MSCPNCNSTDLKKLSLIHAAGTPIFSDLRFTTSLYFGKSIETGNRRFMCQRCGALTQSQVGNLIAAHGHA